MSGVRSILVNSAYLLSARGINIASRAVYALLLTRTLGPELYGLLNYGLAWYLAFLALALFGQPTILLRNIGRDTNNAGPLVNASLALLILTLLSFGMLSLGLSWVIEEQEQTRWMLLSLLLAMFGRGLSEWGYAVQIGYGSAKWVFKLDAILRPLEVLLGVCALALGAGLHTIVAIHIALWIVQGLGQIMAIQRLHQPIRPAWHKEHIRRLVREGLPLSISTLCYVWLLQGILVLGRQVLQDQAALGQLALAVQLIIMLMILPRSIGVAATPVASRALARKDGKDVLYVNTMLRITTLLGGILALGAMVLGEPVMHWAFGEHYLVAGSLLGGLLWIFIPLNWGSELQRQLINHQETRIVTLCGLLSATLMTLSLPLLGSLIGLQGIALGAVFSTLVWALSLAWYYRRKHLHDFSGMPAALLSVGCAVTLQWMLAPASNLLSLLAAIAVMLLTAWLSGAISNAEKVYILGLLRKLKGRLN